MHFHDNLHSFINKEKEEEQYFAQSILRVMPKRYMQRYFQERSEDPDYKVYAYQMHLPTSSEEEEANLRV